MLKKTSKTGYLARLAKDQAKRELLDYAAQQYLAGKASLSELVKNTDLDVSTIMDEVAYQVDWSIRESAIDSGKFGRSGNRG